jgi:hypothetical protein
VARRMRWALAAVVAAGLALVAGLLGPANGVLPVSAPASPQLRAQPAPAALPTIWDRAQQAQNPALASNEPAPKASEASPAGLGGVRLFSGRPVAAEPTHWDLCGVGLVPIPKAVPEAPLSAASAAERAMGEKMAAILGGPPQLPAHWGEQAVNRVFEGVRAVLPQRGPRGRALAIMLSAPNAAEALVGEAERGTDPVVGRWASATCARYDAPPCAARASRAWARMDRSNAAAWMALWAAEPQAEPEVVTALSNATRFDMYGSRIAAELVAAVPAEEPEYLRMEMVIRGIGMDAALPDSTGEFVRRRCVSASAGAALPPWCNTVANVMVNHGDSQYARGLGARMGERMGWPAERLKALREDHQRHFDGQVAAFRETEKFYSCDHIKPVFQVMRAVLEVGEYQAWMQHPAVMAAMGAMAASAPRR